MYKYLSMCSLCGASLHHRYTIPVKVDVVYLYIVLNSWALKKTLIAKCSSLSTYVNGCNTRNNKNSTAGSKSYSHKLYVISIIYLEHIVYTDTKYVPKCIGLFWYLANMQRFNSIRIPREGAHYQLHVIILFMNFCSAVSAFIFRIQSNFCYLKHNHDMAVWFGMVGWDCVFTGSLLYQRL